jgi:S-formylglutathione hydrolase FrmB
MFLNRQVTLIFVINFVLNFNLSAQKGQLLIDLKINSKILQKEILYNIYLPVGYDSSVKKYPVLYLLHGSGPQPNAHHTWFNRMNIQEVMDSGINTGKIIPMIVVMPDAEVTFYMNNINGEYQYEDYFISELIPFIEEEYKSQNDKKFRGIAGGSMGGYGAIVYSLHHPDLFSVCASMAAAIRTDQQIRDMPFEKFQYNYRSALGYIKEGDERITEFWNSYSVLNLIDNTSKERASQVKYYIDIGDDDHLYKGNSLFHIRMRDLEIPHEYRVRDGKHNWDYFNETLVHLIAFISEEFNNR